MARLASLIRESTKSVNKVSWEEWLFFKYVMFYGVEYESKLAHALKQPLKWKSPLFFTFGRLRIGQSAEQPIQSLHGSELGAVRMIALDHGGQQ
uniref:Uncharacterized protein n=1 Tax=Romanomermis culicivorax TaxID=13658 RepID=A0A915K752_ROMCU